ncbi:MAG: hypothetical protein IJT32_02495 [Lachnospiraceae bacterium]|nr:hypothetical protein [Lachnospiraceae bacterium]
MNFNIEDRYAMPFTNNGMPQDASLFGKPGRTADGLSPDGVGKAEKANAAGEEKKPGEKSSPADCETCKNRKYKDGSDEADVSFQTATHIDPSAAGAKVRAHEQEHVSNAYSKAAERGGKVISVGVAIHTAVCPECGRTYVSGGVTHSVISYPQENGAPKIESTNGDPKDKPTTGTEDGGDSKAGAANASGRGSRAGTQDFSVGTPARTSNARTDGAHKSPATINPYAAAQKAAEARRSNGAIFRAQI